MNRTQTVTLITVALGVVATLGMRSLRPPEAPAVTPTLASARAARLVELGSTSCRSCQAMHAELALLRQECGESITVEEHNVWADPTAAQRFNVSVIPTQVFLDAEGREVDRHVGFLARAEIRQRFAQHRVECRR